MHNINNNLHYYYVKLIFQQIMVFKLGRKYQKLYRKLGKIMKFCLEIKEKLSNFRRIVITLLYVTNQNSFKCTIRMYSKSQTFSSSRFKLARVIFWNEGIERLLRLS